MDVFPSHDPSQLLLLAELPPEALLSGSALAASLCVDIRTVRRMVDRRQLPMPFKIGKRKYWMVGKLLEWFRGLAESAERESLRRGLSMDSLT